MLIIGAAAIAVCAYGIIRQIITQDQAQSFYASVSPSAPAAPARQSILKLPMLGSAETAGPAEEEPAPAPFAPDFASLREIMPGLTAWILCEGTPIDFPVVQGRDNDYYLHRLPNGNKNSLGSIFMDYRNKADFSDQNTLIFGHHVKGGLMFGSLNNYKYQDYYDQHPTMMFYTPDKTYVLELFAGYVLDSGFEVPPFNFKSAASFDQYIAKLKRRSYFKSELVPVFGDQLITLVTCDYSFTNARFMLVGKLTEIPAATAE